MNDHSVFLVSVLCKYFSILCGDPKHSEVFAAKIQHKVYVFAPPSCFTGNCCYYVNDVLQMYREGVGIFQKDGLRTRRLEVTKQGVGSPAVRARSPAAHLRHLVEEAVAQLGLCFF